MDEKTSGVQGLSARQKEILRLVARHFEAKEIARRLQISEHTVKAHTDEARRRLGVSTRRQAARMLAEFEQSNEATFLGEPPNEVMAESLATAPISGHDQAPTPERTLLSDQLARTGNSLEDALSTRQVFPDRGHTPDGSKAQQRVWTGESDLQHASGDRVVGGRWDAFTRRLKTLSVWQCLVLVVLISIAMAFLMVALLAGTAATIEAIQTLTGQTR